jgi:hypothetical protein
LPERLLKTIVRASRDIVGPAEPDVIFGTQPTNSDNIMMSANRVKTGSNGEAFKSTRLTLRPEGANYQ